MMMGNSSTREDLEMTVKQMHRGSLLLISGIPHHHCLFNHYFNDYNEAFSSQIGIHVIKSVPV